MLYLLQNVHFSGDTVNNTDDLGEWEDHTLDFGKSGYETSQQTGSVRVASGLECANVVRTDGRAEICEKHIESQFTEDPRLARNMEHEQRKEFVEYKQVLLSEEVLSYYYKDPQGAVQGPFLGVDIVRWFELGYFGTDLPVRLSDAPEDTPFTPLCNLMPHLKLESQKLWQTHGDWKPEKEDAIEETDVLSESTVQLAAQCMKQVDGNDLKLIHIEDVFDPGFRHAQDTRGYFDYQRFSFSYGF